MGQRGIGSRESRFTRRGSWPPILKIIELGLMSPFVRSWKRLRLPLAVSLLAVLVTLPALRKPFTSDDDLVLRERLSDPADLAPSHYGRALVPLGSHRFVNVVQGLFDWVRPDKPVNATALMAVGVFPWYASEEFRIAFWKPVASFTHWLDYQWWPENATAIHLHSILWYAIAAAAISILYRRLAGSTPGDTVAVALAAVLWLADSRYWATATTWMAGRNITLSVVFGALAVVAHDSWRRGGSRGAAILAPLLFGLALLASEPGVAAAAYLLAYAAFLDPARPRARLLSLAPAAAVTLAWRFVYQAMGFGAAGTGIYLDPGREPLRFAAAVIERAPVLLVGQLGWPAADRWEFLAPDIRAFHWSACLAALVVLFALLWPFLRASATARFFALGMFLAVLPVCAAAPVSDRRLLFVGIGFKGLIAWWTVGLLGNASWLPRRRITRFAISAFALGLLGLHVGRPLLATVQQLRHPVRTSHPHLAIGEDPGLADEELVLVTAPNTFLTVYLPFERALAGRPIPRRTRLLSPSFRTLDIHRPDQDSLLLRGVGGSLMTIDEQRHSHSVHLVYALRWTNSALWRDSFPVPAGGRRRLPGMEVEVLEADAAGLPVAVRFDFDRPLEETGRRWLAWSWSEHRYSAFTPPAVGSSVRLAGPFAP